MMYFLDFDRTLFDTDACVNRLLKLHEEHNVTPPLEKTIIGMVGQLMSTVDGLIEPSHLQQYVYADVREYLRSLGNEATILTFGDPVVQKFKVDHALAGLPRISALYTGGIMKGEFMKERIMSYGANVIFVDDTPRQLENMALHAPQVKLFEIRRDGEAGDGRWPVVHSLTELP